MLEYMYATTATRRKLKTLNREISRDVFENITEICKESNLDKLDSNVAKAQRNSNVRERKSSLFVKLVFVIQ